MYITTDTERHVTDIYPFIDGPEDAAISVRVTVSPLNRVWYDNGRFTPFTREEVDQLKAAFDKAFEIVAERDAPQVQGQEEG